VDAPGTYRGQCAELCGKEHGFMPIVVNAVPEDQYKTWVAEQKAKKSKAGAASAADLNKTFTMDELKAQGEKVYTKTCVVCHQANGQGMPPAFPPLAGGKIATGPLAGPSGYRGQRQQEEPGDGRLEGATVGSGDRERRHLRAQLVR
jgi:cytochrome c oxidase subunit 2